MNLDGVTGEPYPMDPDDPEKMLYDYRSFQEVPENRPTCNDTTGCFGCGPGWSTLRSMKCFESYGVFRHFLAEFSFDSKTEIMPDIQIFNQSTFLIS